MKKITFLFILISGFMFSQVKKAKPVEQFDKDLTDYIVGVNYIPDENDFFQKFIIGDKFDDKIIIGETPKVEYIKSTDSYVYTYKLDSANIIVYIKNSRIYRKVIYVFDFSMFMSLVKRYSFFDKPFEDSKGFKMNENYYLVVSKLRKSDYDSFCFDFKGLEYFNIMDVLKSN